MKKRVYLSMALLSAAVAAGNIPLTSQAAELRAVQKVKGDCYKVYVAQGCGSLSEILKELGAICENIGDFCPESNKPETPSPEAPGVPEIPEIPEIPVTPAPELPEVPEIPELPAPETPDAPTPETPNPESPSPEAPALTYAEQVTKLVNEERAKAGLPALELQADITAAANVRAVEIKQKFAHTRPDGSSFSSALKEHGVSFRGCGENIAWGQKSPEQVMDGWMNSDGHRANILNPNYKNIGVGHYQDENGVNHWVQLFTY